MTRAVPSAPGYLRAAVVPDPAAGEDVVAVAARERAGRLHDKRVINAARRDWDAMANTYRNGK